MQKFDQNKAEILKMKENAKNKEKDSQVEKDNTTWELQIKDKKISKLEQEVELNKADIFKLKRTMAVERQISDADQVNEVEVMDDGNYEIKAKIYEDKETVTGVVKEMVTEESEYKEDGQGVEAAKEDGTQSNKYEQ